MILNDQEISFDLIKNNISSNFTLQRFVETPDFITYYLGDISEQIIFSDVGYMGNSLNYLNQIITRDIIEKIEKETGIKFLEVMNEESANIVIGSLEQDEGDQPAAGVARKIFDLDGNYIKSYVGVKISLSDNFQEVLVHEIGHSLGLSHTGDYNGNVSGDGVDPDVDPIHGYHSIMSYNRSIDYWEGSSYDPFIDGDFGPKITPIGVSSGFSAADISVLQEMHNTNRVTSSIYFDDVYNFDERSSFLDRVYYETVIDDGGIDTFDVSNRFFGVEVDLRPGSFSALQFVPEKGIAYSVQIDYNTTIENAISGSGDDLINGNFESNLIRSGSGDDIVYGHEGSDSFFLGAGNDVAYGGSSSFFLDSGEHVNDTDSVFYTEESLEHLSFSLEIESDKIKVSKGSYSDTLFFY
jgi:hypothetical protein